MDTLEARSGEQLRQDYLDRARELQPMLRADSDEIERRREVTPEVVDAMIERGIFKMLLPRSIGGSELDPLTYTAVLELLGQADGSTAWCLGQNSGCSMIAPYLAPEIAREIFGPRQGILAWGPDLRDELLACVDGHRPQRLRRVYRDRPRQGAPRRQGYAAREQRHPVADRAMRGAAQIGARLSAQRHRRDVGRGAADRQDRRRAPPAIAARGDLGDPPGARCRRHRLSRRRSHRDLRVEPARTPHARHPCRDPAGPGPGGA